MRNIVTLVKVLYKTTNVQITNQGKSNKKKKSSAIGKISLGLLLVYSFGVVALMFFALSNSIIESFQALNVAHIALEVLLLMSSVLIFFFGIFMIPTVFYFSDDVQTLLPLPLKPSEIFIAKFIVTLIYEYYTVALIYIPMMIAYVVNVDVNFFFYIQAVIQGILLPIIPLLLAMLFMMVLMRFSKLMRNRDRFNMIVGGIYILVSFGLSFFMSSLDDEAVKQLMLSLIENKEIIGMFSKIIPSIGFAVKGIVYNDVVSLIFSMIIPIIAMYVVSLVSNKLYFSGVIGINETSSKRKKLTSSFMNKEMSSKGILWTYTKKEIVLLFRTPTYFMNCIVGNYMPIFMGVIFYITFKISSDPEITQGFESFRVLIDQVSINYHQLDFYLLAIVVMIAMGTMTTSFNMIASTAISREGTNIGFMKSIPVGYKVQVNAKVLSSIIISFTGVLPVMLFVVFYLKMPLVYLLLGTIGILIGTTFLGYVSILVDIIHPKLLWDSEKVVVKNNINGLIIMALTISLIGVFAFVFIKFEIGLTVGLTIVIISILAMIGVIYSNIPRITAKKMEEI